MSDRSAFETLDVDILNIIVSLLQSDSQCYLQQLRLVSKQSKALVDPLWYRTVDLSEDPKRFPMTRALLDRLLDPNDLLSHYVRHLKITDTVRNRYDEEYVTLDGLETTIDNLYCLQSFRYADH
ncbi:MAG: hypothetical protein L6R39_001572 [Caloplaca ligustica]|nr:MAG: hypothetical protein L6R39_001572 [Caloplaca ligustica]